MVNRKILFSIFLILLFLCCDDVKSQTILKGGIKTFVQKGKVLQVNLSTPINFYFSAEGDKVTGYINEDIKDGKNILIPKGTLVQGVVSKINEPKRFGQDGSFEVEFNEIVISGNRIPIQASVSTDISTKLEKAADIITYDSALIAYGAFNGAIAGIQYGGIPLAVTSHGISVLAGAGVGTGAGLIGSALRKGKIPINNIGQGLPFVLKSNLYILGDINNNKEQEIEIKTAESDFKGFRFNPVLKKDQVELQIFSVKNNHSKRFGDSILLEFSLRNKSSKPVSLSDLKLMSNKKELINPDVFLSGLEVLRLVKPNEEVKSRLQYLTVGKKEHYSFVLIDPLDMGEVVRLPLK